MGRAIDVRDLEPDEHEDWRTLVDEAAAGSPYATSEYLDALCCSTDGWYSIRGAFRGEELVGGLGLYGEGEGIHSVVSPRLLLFYNGPVLRTYETRYPGDNLARQVAILEALETSLREEGFGRIVLKPRSPVVDVRPFQTNGWDAEPTYTLVVPIRDLDGLWKRVDRNVRRLVRRARDEGIEVTEDDDFASFFRLHRALHERKGAPLYLGEKAFEAYFTRLRKRGLLRLYHARRRDGQVISSQMVLASGHPVTHTVSAAADDDHGRTGASPYLRWQVFERLSEEGYHANDLTGATLGPVTRFKNQFGGELAPCFEVSRTRPGFRALRVPRTLNRESRGLAKRLLSPLRTNENGE